VSGKEGGSEGGSEGEGEGAREREREGRCKVLLRVYIMSTYSCFPDDVKKQENKENKPDSCYLDDVSLLFCHAILSSLI